MDIIRAKEILAILAEGVDPTTGEILPEDSVCNKGEVVRALDTVLHAMEEKTPKQNAPENAGKPWTKEDEALLADLYRSNVPKKEICDTFKRSVGAIAARLVRLGLIDDRDDFRNRK